MVFIRTLGTTLVRDAAHLASILDAATASAFTDLDRDLIRMTRDRAWRRAQREKHGRKR